MKITDITPGQIRMARSLLQLNQVDVAKNVGLAVRNYSAIEGNISDPKISNVRKIVIFFESKGIIFNPDGSVTQQ